MENVDPIMWIFCPSQATCLVVRACGEQLQDHLKCKNGNEGYEPLDISSILE